MASNRRGELDDVSVRIEVAGRRTPGLPGRLVYDFSAGVEGTPGCGFEILAAKRHESIGRMEHECILPGTGADDESG